MENYKTLKQFADTFNITDCYNKRFMKRKGGYVFQALINDELVDVVITPLNKDNQPVVFQGSIEKKTCLGFSMEKIKYSIVRKKVLAVSK